MLGRYSIVYEVIAQSPVPTLMPRKTVENPPTWMESPAQEYDKMPVNVRMNLLLSGRASYSNTA